MAAADGGDGPSIALIKRFGKPSGAHSRQELRTMGKVGISIKATAVEGFRRVVQQSCHAPMLI